jgi:hypothetical protein
MQTNTNDVQKPSTLLQTTGGKDGGHVALLGQIILIPIQPIFACLAEKQQIPI